MTYLKELSIEHFKSFFKKQKIMFAIPNGKIGSGLTVIVGPNNVGKSTIFEAFKKLDITVQFDMNERHNSKNVKLIFKNSDDIEKTVYTEGDALGKIINPSVYPNPHDFYIVSSRRHWNSEFSGGYNRVGHKSNFLYKSNKNPVDGQIASALMEISRDGDKKQKFNDSMKELIPGFKDWNIELQDSRNFILYETKSGIKHRTDFMGDGAISLFKIVYHLMDAKENEIMTLDEPELSLHPEAQKRLSKYISLKASNQQIIIATHCPHFITWDDILNGAKIVRVNKFDDKQSSLHILQDDKRYSKKLINMKVNDWQKPHLLDAVAKEFFFSNNILIVEGQEDVGLLKKFAKDKEIELNFDFFGYGAGAAGNIYNLLSVARDLGVKAGAIFDGDKNREHKKANKDFPEFKIEILKTDDIRDKPAINGKPKKIGLFFYNGKVKKTHENYITALINRMNRYFK